MKNILEDLNLLINETKLYVRNKETLRMYDFLQYKIAKITKLQDVHDDINIVFVGMHSSGISSLINAIIGHELLPVSNFPIPDKPTIKIKRCDEKGEAYLKILMVNGDSCICTLKQKQDKSSEINTLLDNYIESNSKASSSKKILQIDVVTRCLDCERKFVLWDFPSLTVDNNGAIRSLDYAVKNADIVVCCLRGDYPGNRDEKKLYDFVKNSCPVVVTAITKKDNVKSLKQSEVFNYFVKKFGLKLSSSVFVSSLEADEAYKVDSQKSERKLLRLFNKWFSRRAEETKTIDQKLLDESNIPLLKSKLNHCVDSYNSYVLSWLIEKYVYITASGYVSSGIILRNERMKNLLNSLIAAGQNNLAMMLQGM